MMLFFHLIQIYSVVKLGWPTGRYKHTMFFKMYRFTKIESVPLSIFHFIAFIIYCIVHTVSLFVHIFAHD